MMPAENPNKADELLKRYAQKRREQAGDGSLHPANRRILQAAVAREYPAAGRAGPRWLEWFSSWRRSLILSGATVGAVLALVWVVGEFSRKQQPLQLAQLEEAETRGRSVAGQPMDRVSESERQANDGGIGGRDLSLARTEEKLVAFNDGARSQPSLRAANPAPSLAGPAETDALKRFGSVTGTAATPQPSGGAADSLNLAEQDAKSVVVATAPPALSKQIAETRSKTPSADSYAVTPFSKETATKPAQAPAEDTKWFGESPQIGQVPAKAKAEQSTVLSQSSSAAVNGPSQLAFRPNESARGAIVAGVTTTQTLADQPSLAAVAPDSALAGAVFFRQTEARQSALAPTASLGAEKKDREGQTVLDRFTVERRGDQVRMIEADGSIYEGTVSADVVADFGTDGVADSRARLEQERLTRLASRGRHYSFRAAGTNRTLRQPVLLNGTFVTDEALTDGDAAGGAKPAVPSPAPFRRAIIPAPSVTAPATNALETNQIRLIEGTVRVGPTNEQRFRAVPGSR